MTVEQKVPKRMTAALFNSLGAGVTPRVGLEHIVVGRKNEISALLHDLDTAQDGGASFRILLGRYGSGKSFLMQLLRNYAMEREFVVADADLSPDRRLAGTSGQGVGTYRELVRNLATRTSPNGGALKAVLEKWINGVQRQVMEEGQYRPSDPQFTDAVERNIFETTQELESLVHGFDFASVIAAYWRGHREGQDAKTGAALKWLRAEYSTKTEARQDLGVRVIIDDDSWYDYLKLLAEFVQAIGYKGLVVVIDEAVNLYKITNTVSRNNNYEKLLSVLNDILQGRARHLAVLLGGTPMFLEDPRRGLFSYEALKSRLQSSRFSRDGLVDMSSPVIQLSTLSNEEIFLLLQRIRDLHALHYGYETMVGDDETVAFMEEVLNRIGASEFLTPRDVIRDFVSVLNILRQNPGITLLQLVKGGDFQVTQTDVVAEMNREDAVPEGGVVEFEL
jgi:hypothetical protein